jgi:hypothetical protein
MNHLNGDMLGCIMVYLTDCEKTRLVCTERRMRTVRILWYTMFRNKEKLPLYGRVRNFLTDKINEVPAGVTRLGYIGIEKNIEVPHSITEFRAIYYNNGLKLNEGLKKLYLQYYDHELELPFGIEEVFLPTYSGKLKIPATVKKIALSGWRLSIVFLLYDVKILLCHRNMQHIIPHPRDSALNIISGWDMETIKDKKSYVEWILSYSYPIA